LQPRENEIKGAQNPSGRAGDSIPNTPRRRHDGFCFSRGVQQLASRSKAKIEKNAKHRPSWGAKVASEKFVFERTFFVVLVGNVAVEAFSCTMLWGVKRFSSRDWWKVEGRAPIFVLTNGERQTGPSIPHREPGRSVLQSMENWLVASSPSPVSQSKLGRRQSCSPLRKSDGVDFRLQTNVLHEVVTIAGNSDSPFKYSDLAVSSVAWIARVCVSGECNLCWLLQALGVDWPKSRRLN